jgi:hypothetical protein
MNLLVRTNQEGSLLVILCITLIGDSDGPRDCCRERLDTKSVAERGMLGRTLRSVEREDSYQKLE